MKISFLGAVFLLATGLTAADFGDTLARQGSNIWKQNMPEIQTFFDADFRQKNLPSGGYILVSDTTKRKPNLTFAGEPVSELSIRMSQGRPVSFLIQLEPSEKFRDPSDAEKFMEKLSDACKKFNPLKFRGRAPRQMLFDGVYLCTDSYKGNLSDVTLGYRLGHARAGDVFLIEFAIPGTHSAAERLASSGSFPLEAFLAESRMSPWRTTASDVFRHFRTKLTWLDSKRKNLSYYRQSGDRITFAGCEAREATFRFSDKKTLESLRMVFYNGTNVTRLKKAISEELGTTPRTTSMRLSPDVNIVSLRWQTPQLEAELRTLEKKTGAPAPSLELVQPGKLSGNLRDKFAPSISTEQLLQNLKNEGGVKMLELPSPTVSGRGPCMEAALSRILLYYGIYPEECLLIGGRIFDDNDTFSEQLFDDALSLPLNATGLSLRKIYENPLMNGDRGLLRFLSYCNRLNRRGNKKAREIKPVELKRRDKRNKYDLSATLCKIDFEMFRSLRLRERGGMEKFEKAVENSIQSGVPLFWLVMNMNNHRSGNIGGIAYQLRFIVGYDKGNNTLLYSENFGTGRARVRMKIDDAWVITASAFTLNAR